ncbi:sterile alpha motif domain-containing protein 9 [Clupea harengus]|uniref:Sterile alpha motif domain-containing protein 9 n=1 Tax=Clupea harengus TaxID=7950 RepID=A0A6P8EJG7_CLUHA|nr:sterile alpha motif domain-containing protein 9 [Clupea harengus]
MSMQSDFYQCTISPVLLSDTVGKPPDLSQRIEDWTREDVRQWLLTNLKVPQEYADILYDEDVSGASLACFRKQDLIDLGIRHGPAVLIVTNVEKVKKLPHCLEICSHTKETAKMTVVKKEPSVKHRDMVALQSANCPNRNLMVEIEARSASEKYMTVSDSWTENKQSSESPAHANLHQQSSDAKADVKPKIKQKDGPSTTKHPPLEQRISQPRPFDQNSSPSMYTQNELFPEETGQTNLIDPIHEFKVMVNTENATEKEILHKFSFEVFRFAAACMNVRTNGTIHFGVADTTQVVGLKLISRKEYIKEFDLQLVKHFEKNQSVARACIRPPKFIPVQCSDGTSSKLWVIEVDIVPNYSETQEKLFYTSVLKEVEGKQCKTECLFVRQGASSTDLLAEKNPRILQEKLMAVSADVQTWASTRKSVEQMRFQKPSQSHQGLRLQQLITLGRDTLEHSLQFLVVTNKCPQSELEHLGFLKELKLFAVLDFDPESELMGTCNFFRKDRIANLHFPRMYNNSENISTTVGKLNLYNQTSWVFCNGRANEDNETDLPFDPSNWLIKRAGEVSDMINLICNPDILPKDRLVVVFLLHSGNTDVSDPLLETFCAIYQKLGGEDNMLCICKDSTVFSQWSEGVRNRRKIDISSRCIYELSLYEVNCTINKVKEPQTQSSERYLPSTDSSSVLLTKRDEELMTFLGILSESQCENTEIEAMESFRDVKTKMEEDFYRGGQVTWWNFYFSEKPGCLPFIKRDKYEDLYNLMTPTGGYTSPCIIISLFHHPGCGGTTLAMHVLWNLRKKFRCVVIKNKTAQNSDIAAQVKQLLTYGKEEQSSYTPVLLLVDNLEDVEELQKDILSAAHEIKKQESVLVIILNCQRSQFPAASSRNSRIDSVFITYELSPREQGFFQEKLKELKGHHEKPETFYAFVIMTNNFSESYIESLVCNTLKDLDVSTNVGQLMSFLALLNTYINGSCMSLSLCEEFVGIRNALWGKETLWEKMNPYSTLFIGFKVEECGTYQAVRFLHQMIAKHCLQVLACKHHLKLSEITTNLLHCDLLYKSGMGKDILVQNILSMLITRQRKQLGDDKDTLFSPLVEEMQKAEGEVNTVLTHAIKRFDRNATVPQALARHFYLKEKDFTSARRWALDAQQKNNNSYIADTLGQVYKSHLRHEIECNKDITPDNLNMYLELASMATKSFKDSQELAKRDESMDCSEQRSETRRRQEAYNTSGYVGEMDVIMIVFQVLEDIPIFSENDLHQWHKMVQFLRGILPMDVSHETSCKANDEFIAVLTIHEKFLVSLKPRMKDIFVFFENYFTYLKPRSIERETVEERNKQKVSELFKKYVKIFCISGEEISKQPIISLQQSVEEKRRSLERERADTFAGLLQCLNEKRGSQMEDILDKWQFIFENSSRRSSTNRVNFILVNIIVHCVLPKSTKIRRYNDLITLLNEVLQNEGLHSDCTEVYYLAMVLLWPGNDCVSENAIFKNICTYVTSTKRSFHRRFHYMSPAKSCIAHFYLGKSKGLKRIVHKAKIDQAIDREKRKKPHQLWQSGAIWKEPWVHQLLLRVKGKTENGEIYVHYPGNLRIPVRPVYLGDLRRGNSMEEVSFYLGFTMAGPVAYDLEYMSI